MSEENLFRWVEEQREKGYSDEEIAEELRESGYKEEAIEEVLSHSGSGEGGEEGGSPDSLKGYIDHAFDFLSHPSQSFKNMEIEGFGTFFGEGPLGYVSYLALVPVIASIIEWAIIGLLLAFLLGSSMSLGSFFSTLPEMMYLIGSLYLLFGWLGGVLISFVGALVVYVLSTVVGSKGIFLHSYVVASYSITPLLLFGWVPFLNLVVPVWILYLLIIGIKKVHKVSWLKSVMAVVLLAAVVVAGFSIVSPGFFDGFSIGRVTGGIMDVSQEEVIDRETLDENTEIITVEVEGEEGKTEFKRISYSKDGESFESFFPSKHRSTLDWIKENTEESATIASWWDYGHAIRGYTDRGVVAYTPSQKFFQENIANEEDSWDVEREGEFSPEETIQDLAGIFVKAPQKALPIMQKHGLDYIYITMDELPKYSAISQVYNGYKGDRAQIKTLSCQRQGRKCKIWKVEGNRVLYYSFSGNANIIVPVEENRGELEISGAPLLRFENEDIVPVANLCTPQGIEEVHAKEGTKGSISEAIQKARTQGRPFGGCVALHPHKGPSNIVVVPSVALDSTLVELYLMDGAEVEYAEKVYDSSPVKIFSVDTEVKE